MMNGARSVGIGAGQPGVHASTERLVHEPLDRHNPVSAEVGWLKSVTSFSALSMCALVSGHWAAWQAARVEVTQDQEACDANATPSRRRWSRRSSATPRSSRFNLDARLGRNAPIRRVPRVRCLSGIAGVGTGIPCG